MDSRKEVVKEGLRQAKKTGEIWVSGIRREKSEILIFERAKHAQISKFRFFPTATPNEPKFLRSPYSVIYLRRIYGTT
jgi:hypothetical protein